MPVTSRVHTKMSGLAVPLDMLIQAMICDRLGLIWWSKTADASKGTNRPEMLSEILASAKGKKDSNSQYEKFVSGEDFMKEWNKLSRKGD